MRATFISGCLLALGSLVGRLATAQSLPPDTPAAVSLLTAAARQLYDSAFQQSPYLYNGPEYIDYARRYKVRTGHQFFPGPEKQPGSVVYNGRLFPKVDLLYDVVLDQLVVQLPSNPLYLRLSNENVRHFTLGEHKFTRLVTDSTTSGISTGFYEVLVDGPVQLMARRAKKMESKPEQRDVNLLFTAQDKLYLRKDNVYYPVRTKSSVLRLFADHGKEIKQYTQEQKLRFSKDQREADIARLTRFYASLIAR